MQEIFENLHKHLIKYYIIQKSLKVYWLLLFLDVLTRVKNIKIVSCGGPEYTNWAEVNSNIITLVTIIMLL